MKRKLLYAMLTFTTLALLGLVAFIAGTLLVGSGSQGCYPEKMSFRTVWIGMLALGSLFPSILVWKQRVSAALVSTLPFGLCSCCACLAFIWRICA